LEKPSIKKKIKNMKNINKYDDPKDDKQSAGQILPDDKKQLKEDMPDHVKSPMNELKDKSDVSPEK